MITFYSTGKSSKWQVDVAPNFTPGSRGLPSCWRTSRMSSAPTSPCTSTKRSWNCRSSPRPAGAACALCRCTSRPPSVLPESTSSGRATPCRPSSSCAPGAWRSWRTAWCWQFSVSYAMFISYNKKITLQQQPPPVPTCVSWWNLFERNFLESSPYAAHVISSCPANWSLIQIRRIQSICSNAYRLCSHRSGGDETRRKWVCDKMATSH